MRISVVSILLMLSFACGTVLAGAVPAEEELSPFDGTLGDAIWTVLAFLILLLVLWKLAWKKILEGLTARETYIEKQIRDAEQTSKEAHVVLAQYQGKLDGVERECRQITDMRMKEADKEARRIFDEARQDGEALRLRQEMELERARRQAESELLDQAGGIVLRLGEEILGRAMKDDDHQRMVDQAIARLRQETDGRTGAGTAGGGGGAG
jgi:F-type H+-transporting ATPase subunit b